LNGRSVELIRLEDASPCGDDVAWEIRDEGDVALLKGVFDEESGEVGTREDRDVATGTVKDGGDCIL
jgi:hypothetical protein